METLAVLGTACVLGFLHALEIDHMLAVTTFVTCFLTSRLSET